MRHRSTAFVICDLQDGQLAPFRILHVILNIQLQALQTLATTLRANAALTALYLRSTRAFIIQSRSYILAV